MKVVLFIIAVCFSVTLSAQNFFKPIPKLAEPQSKFQKNIITPTKVTALDSSFGALRPIVIAAAYSIPDNHLMAGAGFGYQNITYNYSTQRYTVNWSISAVGFAGGAIAPKTPAEVVSYGLMLGVLNNTVMAGPVLNSGKVQLAVSIGINFNN